MHQRFFIGLIVLVVGFLVYSSQQRVTPQPSPSPTSVLGTSDGTTPVATSKEFFVPFGYGTVEKATDWTDVPGMRATINSSLYPKIKQAILEVTPHLADDNQTVWVRLRNYDGYSYPSVSMDGRGPDLRLSSPFSISPGEKMYYIQVKTSGGSTTQIYQARLHITTY